MCDCIIFLFNLIDSNPHHDAIAYADKNNAGLADGPWGKIAPTQID
jgi:hypothetical protein